MNENNNLETNREKNIIPVIIIGVLLVLIIISGATFAYYAFSISTTTTINGTAAKADLTLTVTKTLPNTSGTDNIVLSKYSELPSNINSRCLSGSYAACQLYTISLTNNASNNVNVTGSVSFTNTNAPNLSWVLLNSYSSSTSYTSNDLPNSFNTASSTFTNFVSNSLVNGNTTNNYYLLVWVNSIEEEQTDNGSYTGIVKFEDPNGTGITSTFTS